MGHRALVAYREDDTCRLHYCHWGRGLADHISRATPFGGPVDRSEVARTAAALGVEPFGGYDAEFGTRVDPRPLASDASAADVAATLDASFESLVVVSPTYETATYLVCSLDPNGADGDVVLARPEESPSALRRWFVETKSRLSARVARGALSRRAARATLGRALAARTTVYSPDGARFLRVP